MRKLMSNEDYHKSEGVGSSLLKEIHNKTIYHAINKTYQETPSMLLGRMVHALVLEPETFKNENAIGPEVKTRNSKEWKEFAAENEGKNLFKPSEIGVFKAIADSVLKHPISSRMLTGGEAEFSYFATDKDTGLLTKCRPDYFNGGGLIDLKTTADASFEGFSRQIGNLAYHIQAAFYLDVFNSSQGTTIKDFFFVAVETKAPYAVAAYKLDDLHIEAGREAYKNALSQYAKYMEEKMNNPDADVLYGYPCEIQNIQVPYYMLDKIKAV